MNPEKAKVTIDLDEYVQLRQLAGTPVESFSFIKLDLIISKIKEAITVDILKTEATEDLKFSHPPSQRDAVVKIYAHAGVQIRDRIIELIIENSK